MIGRRRFAHGSSTDAQHMQRAAVQAVDAHLQVQAAARAVSVDLDELSLGVPVEIERDDSMVVALETAQRVITPS
jgi:CO/xanthine dehydrogenase Mo-binding subunit